MYWPGRVRDVFPMPRVTSLPLFLVLSEAIVGESSMLDFTNLALAGLGLMHGDAKGSINRKPTPLQLQVQRNVTKRAYGLYMHLGRVASADRNIIFASCVGRDERSKYPLIDPDKVDGLTQAGLVDPLPF